MRKILVTKPSLPPLDELTPLLEDIWKRGWITNKGYYHRLFEEKLSEYLGVNHLSLVCNGTIALQIALKAANVKKHVITTPYTFIATSHALKWADCSPTFCDITYDSFNIDPSKIESLICAETEAILPVHVYGLPCQNQSISRIAKKHNLPVIYDAAHAFGVKVQGRSILEQGDISILSFHATKVFNTIEGGALVSQNREMKEQIDDYANFSIKNEETISGVGINGKLNELQAAYGLVQLRYIDGYISKNKQLALLYNSRLFSIPGITTLTQEQINQSNASYYPVTINESLFGASRDRLYEELAKLGINARKYFYPLISDIPVYKKDAENASLSHAKSASKTTLCLPIYSDLSSEDVHYICDGIEKIHENIRRNI